MHSLFQAIWSLIKCEIFKLLKKNISVTSLTIPVLLHPIFQQEMLNKNDRPVMKHLPQSPG